MPLYATLPFFGFQVRATCEGPTSLFTQPHLQLSQSNQSFLLWLLLRTVWPFCTWPFLDFSLCSSPSSSDSVSSLSLRSSSTMCCQVKQDIQFVQLLVWGESVMWWIRKCGGSYIAWQEFDDHAQDEPGPEDVQSLQHKHQPVEEVEAEEGTVEGEWVHTRRVYDPGRGDKGRTESPVRATYSHHQKPIERDHDCTQCVCCSISI